MRRRGQGVVHVKDLFAKYAASLKAPQKTVIQAFIQAVSDVVGHTLTASQCTYSVNTRTITLAVSGIIKTEILFKKQQILTRLTTTLGERSAPKEIL
jgi:hypothetical protein